MQQPLVIVQVLREQTKLVWCFSSSFHLSVDQPELGMYLKSTGHVQRHLFYVGSRKRPQAVLSPLLDKVVERLLSSVLHSEALGAIFGRGESTKTWVKARKTRS